MLDSAIDYAARGWHVFPLLAGTKRPATEHGLLDATRDQQEIYRWWSYEEFAHNPNIGIRTGAISGIVVLDVDFKHNGWESLGELLDARAWPDGEVASRTPNGVHYYFAHPGGEVRNGTNVLGYRGLDIRGDGGYVVAPPSVVNGNAYAWDSGGDYTLPTLPDYLSAIRPRNHLDHLAPVDNDTKFPEGTRNDSLVRLAGAMRRYGASGDSIIVCLLDTNRLRCNPPLSEEEVRNIGESVTRYEPDIADSARRGEGRNRRNLGDEWGRTHDSGFSGAAALRGTSTQRNLRSGAWYLGRGR